MPNLFDKLGRDYVNQSFTNAYFLYNDTVCVFDAGRGSSVHCSQLKENGNWENIVIPADYFDSFNVFKHPQLGYRNMGVSAVLWESVRSTARGFRQETVGGTTLDFGLARSGGQRVHLSTYTAKELFFPNFIPYHEGLAQIIRGERFAFAFNKDAAVRINPEGSPPMELLFKGRQAGVIDEKGVLTLTSKTLRNSKTYSKLQGVPA